MENIDVIKIIQVDGLNAGAAANNNGEFQMASSGGNLADQVVNSALRYRAQAPLLDSLMREVGIEGGDINGLTNIAHNLGTNEPKPHPKPAQQHKQQQAPKAKPGNKDE